VRSPAFSSTRRVDVPDNVASSVFTSTHLPSHNTQRRVRPVTLEHTHIWNDLPLSLRSMESVDSFKKQLKTYLFAHAFA
jgi:hypothetical protein